MTYEQAACFPVALQTMHNAVVTAGRLQRYGLKAWQPPAVPHKRLVASRRSWEHFGPLVAAAAWAMGLFAAPRRAFLGDGAVPRAGPATRAGFGGSGVVRWWRCWGSWRRGRWRWAS